MTERFVDLALKPEQAELRGEIAKQNRLLSTMWSVEDELKLRAGDERRALLPLYGQPSAQVRLKAATATLALAPEFARDVLQSLSDAKRQPYAGEAGMRLWALDQGIFNPT